MAILQYKQAAKQVGLKPTELYNGLRSGRYPGFRVGGERGRWVCDVELLKKRIQELMEQNIKQQESQLSGKIRKIY